MNSERELFRAYQEWRRLAEAETKAIQTRNWSLLMDCQRAIQDYQALVTSLVPEVREVWQHDKAHGAAQEKNLSTFVSELIALTQHNRSLLNAARDHAQIRLNEINLASLNLSRLKRSYSPLGEQTLLQTA